MTNMQQATNNSIINSNSNINQFAILKIFIEDNELKNLYKIKIDDHNNKIKNSAYPDSGFDLFVPTHYNIESSVNGPTKIDMKVKCSMKMDLGYNDTNSPVGFYMYPRSSIYKTPLRLANSVGIIDSGYRGSLMSIFDNCANAKYDLEKHTRLVQICSPDLRPIVVIMVDNIEELGFTERGENGFGSTGV